MINKLFRSLAVLLFLFPSICQADITTGLVGWWKMDEASGTTATDSSSSALNGTLSGSTTPGWIAGKINSGLSFNGTTAYVNIPDASSVYAFANTTFTVSFWEKTTTGGGILIAKNGGASGWNSNSGAAVQFNTKNSSGNSAIRTSSTSPCGDGQWHMATGVIQTSTTVLGNNNITIYVDGVVNQGTQTQSNTYTSPTTGDLNLGQRIDGATSHVFFSGSVDDVRIYNRGLTAADVLLLYNTTAPGHVINNAVIKNASIQ